MSENVSNSTVNDDIDEIIEIVFNIDRTDFDDGTILGPDGLGAESLDVVEVSERIKSTTGVEIPDDDLPEMETIGDVKEFVRERKAN